MSAKPYGDPSLQYHEHGSSHLTARPTPKRRACLDGGMIAKARDAVAALGARALRTRWLVRAPILLYRAGLGFLFGSRLLMLEHVGRTSGARRFVVLEVVERPGRDEYVIVSGFGPRAQWYRNILAEPMVRVSCGFRRGLLARATPLSDDESAAALRRYAEAHPKAWANLRASIEAAVGRAVEGLPMVSVRVMSAD
jgi:deazaflavin-dependent oxidoreductase (nitroreductase family)